MRKIILMGKSLCGGFWVGLVLSLFDLFSADIAKVIGIAAVVILLIHIFELMIFSSRINQTRVEPKFDKVQVMLFGVFHLLAMFGSKEQSKTN